MKYKSWKPTRALPCRCLEEAPRWTCWLLLSLVSSIFLLFCVGTIFLIAFIAVHPKPPHWDITEIQLKTLALHNNQSSTIASPLLNMEMLINMSAHNRIKKQGLYYEPAIITSFLFSELGGQVSIPPFHQNAKETKLQSAVIRGREVPITRTEEAEKLRAVMSQRIESIDAQVEVDVRAKVHILGLLKYHYRIRLHCDVSVTSPLLANRSSSLISKACQETIVCLEQKHWL